MQGSGAMRGGGIGSADDFQQGRQGVGLRRFAEDFDELQTQGGAGLFVTNDAQRLLHGRRIALAKAQRGRADVMLLHGGNEFVGKPREAAALEGLLEAAHEPAALFRTRR